MVSTAQLRCPPNTWQLQPSLGQASISLIPFPTSFSMKNAERQLRTALTESLQNNLSGLNKKHAKKLQKTVARAVKQLARKFAKLTAKELKDNHKSAPATHALPKPAIRTTRTAAKRPATAKAATKS